jgi:glycosyltransferase involved in cell wall biosynthesis
MREVRYTIVIPAYNEEEAIVQTIKDVKNATSDEYEILVVDDGSTDKTHELATRGEVKVIRHEVNKGKATAIKTGVENALGEIILTIDADCTYEAKAIPHLIKIVEDGADLAIGSRFLGRPKGMTLLNKIGNKIFSSLITLFTEQKITDAQSGLRAFHKDLFYRLAVKAKGLDWETEITARAVKEGYLVREIPIKYTERVGKSKLRPFADGYRMLRAAFRGTRPLSGLRKILIRREIGRYTTPKAKILYMGHDGGDLVSHLVETNVIHYVGTPIKSIPKGIIWKEDADFDYDNVVVTHLQDVLDDLAELKFAYEHLKKNGKIFIWLSNPNAHAVLSWLMILRLIGEGSHIRYYSGNVQNLLRHFGFKDMLYRKCNLHMNIVVVGKKT